MFIILVLEIRTQINLLRFCSQMSLGSGKLYTQTLISQEDHGCPVRKHLEAESDDDSANLILSCGSQV